MKTHEPNSDEEQEERRMEGLKELLWMAGVAGVATTIKLLLIPCYRSTDFEVHRHWLAITSSLPMTQWYYDQTSEWTLDYPPFFAWFEKFLSVFAHAIDPTITNLKGGLNYDFPTVVIFQRVTVMVADIVMYWGLWKCCKGMELAKQRVVYACVVWSPMLLIVDHVHFQYNGFLLGILLVSLGYVMEGRDLLGGVTFAVLVCFKHLFAVAGPVYFVYLLRHYCRGRYGVLRFFELGASVGAVVGIAFGPFAYHGQIFQLLKRLFPFGRGLCHAYWAPNFWALYNASDKCISFMLKVIGFNIHVEKASLTGGLVGDSSPYAVLPQVKPMHSLLLVLLAMLPCLLEIWKAPRRQRFIQWVGYAYTCGFMFGWHVHEKASLHFVIPLSLVAINSLEHAGHYLLLSIVSCYSIFPLLYEGKEYPIKVLLLGIHGVVLWQSFVSYFRGANSKGQVKNDDPHNLTSSNEDMHIEKSRLLQIRLVPELVGKVGQLYLFGLLACEIWGQIFHSYFFHERLPFLPLMLQSVYCSLGMIFSFIFQAYHIISLN